VRLGVLALLAATSATAGASELTVFRPTDFIAQEWSYYIVIGGRALSDVRPGERVTLPVPPETRTVVIQCPKTLGGYSESRIDYDFKANAAAYLLLSSRPECVNIQPIDAKAAAALMRQTRERASRPLEYDPAPRMATPAPPAAATVASAATIPAGDAAASVVAATAAWVEAFNSRDPVRLSALYDAEAVLSDTSESEPRIGAAAIADYYRSAPQRPTQRVALGERSIRVFGDTAIDSGTYNFFEMRDGQATLTPARYTLVYRNRGGKWLIVDHQSAPATR
jgi:uncharacterized protein (TIGR02246 family)